MQGSIWVNGSLHTRSLNWPIFAGVKSKVIQGLNFKLLQLGSYSATTNLMTRGIFWDILQGQVKGHMGSNLKIPPIGLKLSDNKPHHQENMSKFIHRAWGQMSHRSQILKLLWLGSNSVTTSLMTGETFESKGHPGQILNCSNWVQTCARINMG